MRCVVVEFSPIVWEDCLELVEESLEVWANVAELALGAAIVSDSVFRDKDVCCRLTQVDPVETEKDTIGEDEVFVFATLFVCAHNPTGFVTIELFSLVVYLCREGANLSLRLLVNVHWIALGQWYRCQSALGIELQYSMCLGSG